MKKLGWIIVVILIVAGLVAVRIKRLQEKESAPLVKIVPPAVRVAPVAEGRVVHTRQVLGTVIGSDEAAVAPRVMAQVTEVAVREGAVVRKGQLLAQLDPRELQDAVAQAEAGVQAAKEGLAAAETAFQAQHDATARDEKLFEAKAISQEQWDFSRAADEAAAARLEAAKAQLEVAGRRLDQAKTRLGYCRLTAPFDGVVAARLANPGDLGLPGKPVLKIVRNSGVRIRADVPPEDFTLLKVGQPLALTLNDITVGAKISRVFPAMGPSHLAAFEADLSDAPAGFVSGATVGVDLELYGAEGVRVPTDALLEGDSGAFVFKVAGDTVHPVKVRILARSLDDAVVQGDVALGDTVIAARPSRLMTLTDGMKVKVVRSEAPEIEGQKKEDRG